ncbi:MAG: hypothetical protein HKO66_11125 [Saprospiraceae bacterium]|nr:hypothetical protein [Bacteroidia bacterium]NNE13962.1 hypothetical protein [Saprospiraceae bacterium]NNL92778.1 hypothetical protein [Saprospiraceae bacterium]
MNKAYILNSCSTCQRILKEIDWKGDVQNIKEENIDEKLLDKLAKEHGSYESLFSKRAMKYRSMGLNEMDLSEADYKKYMLQEYTFLKRPFIIIGDKSFIGNSKKTVEAIKNHMS